MPDLVTLGVAYRGTMFIVIYFADVILGIGEYKLKDIQR